MSKISIKTDFVDGDKLFSQQLNNNFLVIQAGVNANEENLQEVIDQAIIELDAELEAITADRGWDWNGGNRVTFYKGNTSAINSRQIVNGQLLYNTETGETALDDNNSRIVTGSGNVIAIGETAPTNPATKEWIKPSKILNYAASYVVDSMEGTDTDKSPSVSAVKDYVSNIATNLGGTVLWENEDASVAFESQSITLSSDDYDFYEVYGAYNYTSYMYANCFKSYKGKGVILSIHGYSTNVSARRKLDYVDDTHLLVSDGYGDSTKNDIYAIPLIIVGYKTGTFD